MHLLEAELILVSIVTIKQKLSVGAIYCPPRHNLKKDGYKGIVTDGDTNAEHFD